MRSNGFSSTTIVVIIGALVALLFFGLIIYWLKLNPPLKVSLADQALSTSPEATSSLEATTSDLSVNSSASPVTFWLSKEEAATKALSYINQELLSGTATAIVSGDIEIATSAAQFYRFKIKVGANEVPSYVYISADGKLLFPESIDLSQFDPKASTKAAICDPFGKKKQAVLEAFVVSQCPFGLQMQRIFSEIAKTAPALKNSLVIRYIGSVENGKITAMHGEKEAQENLLQICLREEQNAKFFNYLDCLIKKGDTSGCLKTAVIDETKLNVCMADPQKGLKYASSDFALANSRSVAGSPSLFLNAQKADEFDFGGRTAQAVKELVCCGFNTKPAVCSQELKKDEAASGYSEQYSGASSSGSCATP